MISQSKTSLDRAGTALLYAARLGAQVARKPGRSRLNDMGFKALLAEARRSLAKAALHEDPYRFLATKTALEALEAAERGEAVLNGVELFKAAVETLHGGEREIDLGGRPRVGRKPSADQAFLRAAAVALWARYPAKREQLVNQSRTLFGVGTKASLQKLVENFQQRHDVDTAQSGSPLSVHMDLVRDLIENHGYRTLNDFA